MSARSVKSSSTVDHIKPTRRTRRVLAVLLTGADGLSGYPIARQAGCGIAATHRILSRLLDAGWVTGQWDHHADGEPRHQYFRLTPEGTRQATRMLDISPVPAARPGRDELAPDEPGSSPGAMTV